MAIIGQGIINAGASTGGVGSIDAATLQGHPASYFTPATTTAALSGSVANLQQQVGGLQDITSHVVFKEPFTADGTQDTFQLIGDIQNAAFSAGSWGSGYIILSLQAYITDLDGKVIYDSIIPIYRDKIQVSSIDSAGLVTTDFKPMAGQQGYIWYWYQLTSTDALSYYYREDFVTYMESEAGDDATLVYLGKTPFSDVVVKGSDVTVDDALHSIDTYVAAMSGNINGFIPVEGTGIVITPLVPDQYTFAVDDYISKTEVDGNVYNLQSQIDDISASNFISGIQGRMPLNDVDLEYTIIHSEVNPSIEFPVVSLETPNPTTDIFVVGVYDRTSTSFKVVISGVPSSSYAILWHISTSVTKGRVEDVDITFTYDTSGNLQNSYDIYGTKTYYYDIFDTLVAISGTGYYKNISFIYDIDGNLIKKEVEE